MQPVWDRCLQVTFAPGGGLGLTLSFPGTVSRFLSSSLDRGVWRPRESNEREQLHR